MIRAKDQKELQNFLTRTNNILQKYSAVSMNKPTTTISHAEKTVNNATKCIDIFNYNMERF